MHAFVVIPCLNEVAYLEETCASLGFEGTADYGTAELVLVDNGSSDGTPDAMRRVQARAGTAKVHLVTEHERGFVPARRAGAAKVEELMDQRGYTPPDVLLIQADADTRYADGYIAAMVDAAARTEPGVLFVGRTSVPEAFMNAHTDYVALCDEADASVSSLCVPASLDVIVDDKACAYRIGDYAAWGGFLREYGAAGEILAETTRLYLRATASGARKITVDAAVASSSRRRVLEHPALQFVTAGYPRGENWSRDWCRANMEIDTFGAMNRGGPLLEELLFLRKAHSIILFGALPAWVAQTVGTPVDARLQQRLQPLLGKLQSLSLQTLKDRPGEALETALGLIDAAADTLRRMLVGDTST